MRRQSAMLPFDNIDAFGRAGAVQVEQEPVEPAGVPKSKLDLLKEVVIGFARNAASRHCVGMQDRHGLDLLILEDLA